MARLTPEPKQYNEQASPEFVQRAKVLIIRHQYQDVVKICRLGLLAHPTTIEGRLVLGMALMALGRYDDVLAEMRVVLELNPNSSMAYLLNGEALFHKHDLAQAKEILKRAHSLDPRNLKIQKLLDELQAIDSNALMVPPLSTTETRAYPVQQVRGFGSRGDYLPYITGKNPKKLDPDESRDLEGTSIEDNPLIEEPDIGDFPESTDDDHFTTARFLAPPDKAKGPSSRLSEEHGYPPSPEAVDNGDWEEMAAQSSSQHFTSSSTFDDQLSVPMFAPTLEAPDPTDSFALDSSIPHIGASQPSPDSASLTSDEQIEDGQDWGSSSRMRGPREETKEVNLDVLQFPVGQNEPAINSLNSFSLDENNVFEPFVGPAFDIKRRFGSPTAGQELDAKDAVDDWAPLPESSSSEISIELLPDEDLIASHAPFFSPEVEPDYDLDKTTGATLGLPQRIPTSALDPMNDPDERHESALESIENEEDDNLLTRVNFDYDQNQIDPLEHPAAEDLLPGVAHPNGYFGPNDPNKLSTRKLGPGGNQISSQPSLSSYEEPNYLSELDDFPVESDLGLGSSDFNEFAEPPLNDYSSQSAAIPFAEEVLHQRNEFDPSPHLPSPQLNESLDVHQENAWNLDGVEPKPQPSFSSPRHSSPQRTAALNPNEGKASPYVDRPGSTKPLQDKPDSATGNVCPPVSGAIAEQKPLPITNNIQHDTSRLVDVKRGKNKKSGTKSNALTALVDLLLNEATSKRWLLVLICTVGILLAAISIGLGVRYFRLGGQIEAKQKLAVARLHAGNLPDFMAAAQHYSDILARRPGDPKYFWILERIQTTIPFEFGDPHPKAHRGTKIDNLTNIDQLATVVIAQLMEGNWEQALEVLNQALTTAPKQKILLYLIGRIELLKGDAIKAENYFRQAHALDQKDTFILCYLGHSLGAQGKTGPALETFNKALTLNPDHVASLIGKSQLLVNSRQSLAQASDELQSLIQGKRRHLSSRGQRGWTYLILAQLAIRQGQIDQGKHFLDQAKSNMPLNDALFLDTLVGALIDSFQLGEARRMIEESKKLIQNRPQPFYQMARIHLQQGLPQAALTALEGVKRLEFTAVSLLKAEIYLELGKLRDAEDEIDRTLGLSNDLLDAHIIKAKIEAARGLEEEAEQRLRSLMRTDAHNSRLLTALGELYLKLGKTRDAREKFNEAITFDKSAFMAQLRLAQVYEAEGNYQEALNSLTAASRANYGNVIILKELARLESDLGDLNEASANYQAIVSRLPSDAASHLALAKLLTLLRQYPQAAKEIQLAEAQKAYAEAISLARGRLALSQGKLAQAIALLQKSVAGERMSLEAWDLLVQAHLQNGDESSAKETVGQMSKRAANIPEIDVAGGRIALNSGQVTEAINHFKRAVSLLPKNSRSPWVRAEMLVLLGRAYQENGMLKQAEEKYNEASQVCNLCAEPHYRKGLVLDERGAQEQALQSIQRAVTLNPSLMDAYYDLGQVLERDGQVAKAIEAYEKYISLDPPAELREAAAEAIRNLKN